MKTFFYAIADKDNNLVTLKNGGGGVDSKAIFSTEDQAYNVLVKSGMAELRVRKVEIVMTKEITNEESKND